MNKYISSILIIVFLCTSCNNNDASFINEEENEIRSIEVILPGRGVNESDDNESDLNEGIDNVQGEKEPQIYSYTIPFETIFDKKSVIFISQKTDRTNPFRTQEDIYPFIYKEEYDTNKDPENDWYDENVYNFTPRSTTNPLEWFKIGNTGSYLNGYGLYALYFPCQSDMTWKLEGGNILYSVAKDQTNIEDLIKSDILGAYHSTLTLFSRLTFRMFHLMTYIGVRLYVPIYDPVTKTGYYDSSLLGAYVENANNEFSIEWNVNIHSDYAGPKVKSPESKEKIKMYLHALPEGINERPVIPIKYTDFVYEGYFDQGLTDDIDYVKVYDFSVLVPMQESFENMDAANLKELPDLLSFWLKSNSGADNIYYFKQSYVKNDEETGKQNVIKLDQGTYQYLELYLPRVGNKVIYAGSKLNKWDEHSVNFPLSSNEEDEADNS